jgi:hypothetical protein
MGVVDRSISPAPPRQPPPSPTPACQPPAGRQLTLIYPGERIWGCGNKVDSIGISMYVGPEKRPCRPSPRPYSSNTAIQPISAIVARHGAMPQSCYMSQCGGTWAVRPAAASVAACRIGGERLRRMAACVQLRRARAVMVLKIGEARQRMPAWRPSPTHRSAQASLGGRSE